jgi:hypothetical protein
MTNVASYRLDGLDVITHFVSIFEVAGKQPPIHLLDTLTKGKFFALAPEGIDPVKLKQFNLGGVVPAGRITQHGSHFTHEVNSLASSLAKIICSKFSDRKYSIVIREPYLKVGDKSEILNELSLIDDGLFAEFDGDLIDEPSLTGAIRRYTVPWSFLLIVADEARVKDGFDELVSRSNLIAVNAYDGESYLYWRRDA